jgi:glycosyltransferase involved in cell wall biosynthesis
MLLATVIICTRDRHASLARTLESLVTAAARVTEPWELLVVDNGSTDATPDTIAGFSGRLPIRRVDQPVAGLSNARNAGVRESRGDFVLWTDDDVLVDENWLAAYFTAFRRHPDVAVFGGRSEPVYEEPVQEWFRANQPHLQSLLAIRDEPSWVEITADRVPYGLNYAIRGQEQRAHTYDPELGVAPGRRRGGEEVALIRAILASGQRGRWVWDATVFHLIPAARQRRAYIRQFYTANGFDFPVAGARDGTLSSLKGAAIAARLLLLSGALSLTARPFSASFSTRHFIRATRARASIARYLGRRLRE